MPVNHGHDLSHWNVSGNLVEVPQHLVMMTKATHGGGYVDPTFLTRFAWFRQRKFKYRGLYHFFSTDASLAANMANLHRGVRDIGGLQRGEFIAGDWETENNKSLVPSWWIEQAYEELMATYGDRNIIYSSDWLPDSTLDADSRAEFIQWRQANPNVPLWYANSNLSSSQYGGAAECAKFHADAWQFGTQMSPGFLSPIDVNMILNFETFDRITDQQEETPMKVRLIRPVDAGATPDTMDRIVFVEMDGKLALHLVTRHDADILRFIGIDPGPDVEVPRSHLKNLVLATWGINYPATYPAERRRTTPADFGATF